MQLKRLIGSTYCITPYNVPELEVSSSPLIPEFEQNAEVSFSAFCPNAGICIPEKQIYGV